MAALPSPVSPTAPPDAHMFPEAKHTEHAAATPAFPSSPQQTETTDRPMHRREQSTDSTMQGDVKQGTPQHYQQHLPRFNGRITSMQSTDSRDMQTPSPDLGLTLRPEDEARVQTPLASPSYKPQTIHQGPLAEPQMAIISSGDSNRTSQGSSVANFEGSSVGYFDEDPRRTHSPVSQVSSTEDAPRPTKLYPQLQYHHQQIVEATPGEQGGAYTRNSSSPSSDGQVHNNRHLNPNAALRRPSRPASTYSLAPDARNRSPSSQQRAVSSNSYDSRRSSFVDLTQLVHMQAQARPATTLDNSHLREQIGSNASLLSNKQTLEMYRANAKKSQDPMLQYELALFMITSAQQQDNMLSDSPAPRSSGEPNTSPYSEGQNAAAASKKELLREARQILERLSNRLPQAQYYLADAFASGLFNKGKEENEKAFPLFVAASKHGHAEAGYRAALCYEFGWGCRKDPAKAVQFYRQSASKNHPGAMTRLGMACLRLDLGLQGRYREGVKWLKRATDIADEQYPQAPYELGLLHETGFGDDVFQDPGYSAQLFTQAAELGHAEASFRLGDAYEHGKLTCPRDAALSVHFYTGAAQNGHPLAMMALCAWYLVGAEPVLEKNEDEAYQWALRATEFGLPKAEYAVGYFTEMGIGCRRDPLEANVWYVKAADHGDERAVARLKIIHEAASGTSSVPKKKGKPSKEEKKETAKLKKDEGGGEKNEKGEACTIM